MGEESGCRVPGLWVADNSLALSRAPGASPKDSSPQSMCRAGEGHPSTPQKPQPVTGTEVRPMGV